mgnify:CR=1 FL=1
MTAVPDGPYGPPWVIVAQLPDETEEGQDIYDRIVATRHAIGDLPPGTQVTIYRGPPARRILDAVGETDD